MPKGAPGLAEEKFPRVLRAAEKPEDLIEPGVVIDTPVICQVKYWTPVAVNGVVFTARINGKYVFSLRCDGKSGWVRGQFDLDEWLRDRYELFIGMYLFRGASQVRQGECYVTVVGGGEDPPAINRHYVHSGSKRSQKEAAHDWFPFRTSISRGL